MTVNTEDVRKLIARINEEIQKLGFSEVKVASLDLNESEDKLNLLFFVSPETMLSSEERDTLRDFNAIVSNSDLVDEGSKDSYEEKLDRLRQEHSDDWDLNSD